jgi:hypothetical protein
MFESRQPDSGASAPRVATAPQTPQDLFAAEVEAVLRSAPEVTSVERLANDFGFSITRGGESSDVFLGNIFAETRDVPPEERAAKVRFFIQSIVGRDEVPDWEEAKARLVPLLRGATYLPETGHFVGRPALPFLVECVGIDFDGSFGYANGDHVRQWSVTSEELFRVAEENAARYFADSDIESYDERAPYPIWHVARDDSYQSSRLLLPGWLASFRGRVNGTPVAIVPDRSTLIVGGDADEACLRRLIEIAQKEFGASTRHISTGLYTVSADGSVTPFVLPPGHALANDVALGHTMLAMSEYGSQKDPLQQKLGESVFVASYLATKSKTTGAVQSVATWSRGAETLLPRTDAIAFNLNPGSKPSDIFRVSWNDVEQIAGRHLRPEPALNPPRWRTIEFPDEAMLARLRALAIG